MKKLLIVLLLPVFAHSQKLAPYKYRAVDSVTNYDNAEIIKYRSKSGELRADTIWFNNQKQDIEINSAGFVTVYRTKLKPKVTSKQK